MDNLYGTGSTLYPVPKFRIAEVADNM